MGAVCLTVWFWKRRLGAASIARMAALATDKWRSMGSNAGAEVVLEKKESRVYFCRRRDLAFTVNT